MTVLHPSNACVREASYLQPWVGGYLQPADLRLAMAAIPLATLQLPRNHWPQCLASMARPAPLRASWLLQSVRIS